ncbi:hypothetical protein BKA70DRAFT_1403989, partial [Coprinopsis sp. MPI-PUGE-AT-0042]
MTLHPIAGSFTRPVLSSFPSALIILSLVTVSRAQPMPDWPSGDPPPGFIVTVVVCLLVFFGWVALIIIVGNRRGRHAEATSERDGYMELSGGDTARREVCGLCPGCRVYINQGGAHVLERDEAGYANRDTVSARICLTSQRLTRILTCRMSIQRLHLPIRRVWTVKPWVLSGCRQHASPHYRSGLPSAFRDIAEKPAEALVFYKWERLL